MKVALAQINSLVGDIDGNAAKIIQYAQRAHTEFSADLVVFPELALTGYPPEDLLFREGFLEKCEQGLRQIADKCAGFGVLVGYPRRRDGMLYNSAAVLIDKRISYVYDKQLLPNYGVFDEVRYFKPGTQAGVFEMHGHTFGITVCEDIWQPGPVAAAVKAGAQLIININASPFHIGKVAERREVLQARCRENSVPIVYVNCVGGQDELVFDGASAVIDRNGAICYQAPEFAEHLNCIELKAGMKITAAGQQHELLAEDAGIYQALVLAIRDYVRKNGFSGVALGLSGGVDSALTLALAVDALGADAVEAVMMPSRHTARISLEDAAQLAAALNVSYAEISIEPVFRTFLEVLQPSLKGYAADTTEENIQARCRGVMLMAISNKKRKLVLATGNKSELAVGYATLYGDMAGGYAPLKDLTKQRVYQLCAYRNRNGIVIPKRILERAPSAELAPNQTDQDSLPPYDVLDRIIELYLEQEKSVESIIAAGFDEAVVQDVVGKINRNEYKRRQAAPGVKITKRAFGRERRYPITGKYQ
jgi:NAD+ synthase (glutamine-hydrolysing)